MMSCLLTLLFFDFGLADSDGGLVTPDPIVQWEYGTATSGPMTGPVWATRLSGSTLNDVDATLVVPLPDLSAATRPVLVLEHWYSFGGGDLGVFEIDTGAGYIAVEPIGGYPAGGPGYAGESGGWVLAGLDLTGVPATASLRLRLDADSALSGPGWYLRALRVEDGDPIPPVLSVVTSPDDTQDLAGPYPVSVDIEEDLYIETAAIAWTTGAASGREPLALVGGTTYAGGIPAQPPGSTVSWAVEVEDCSSTAILPGAPFRVYLAAPEDLAGPVQPHEVARSVTLTWSPPVSPHVPDAYEVENIATNDVFGPFTQASADVPLEPGEPQDFVVRALYAVGVGDDSAVLSLDVEVPELRLVEPAAVFPGDRVYVEIEGRSLYLLDGVSTLWFGGEGVDVASFEVRDVNRGIALVEVADDVSPGARDLVVTGAQGAFGFEDAFAVLDGADAPRIVSVEPDSIVQGDEVVVTVTASQAFAGPVDVTTDDEILVGGAPTVDGNTLTLTLAAAGRSRTGGHDLIFDDGERLWAASIEVDEYVVPPRTQCGVVPAWPSVLGSLMRRR